MAAASRSARLLWSRPMRPIREVLLGSQQVVCERQYRARRSYRSERLPQNSLSHRGRCSIHVKADVPKRSEDKVSFVLENSHGVMKDLVCLDALRAAIQEVEEAEFRCREASHMLANVRGELDRAVEQAYEQQSFAPLGELFDEEEAALAVYEQARAQLASAEERWRGVGAALAYEKEQMLAGGWSRERLN